MHAGNLRRIRLRLFGRRNVKLRVAAASYWICASIAVCTLGISVTTLGQDLETNAPTESPIPTTTLPPFGSAEIQPASASGNPGMAPSAPIAGTSQLAAPSAGPATPASGQAPLNLGFVHLFPHVNYQFSYGNGLQATPGQQSDTIINQVSPGILMRLGNQLTLDYTPTLRYYSDPHFKDGVDQSVSLNWATTYQDWILGLSQSYLSTSQPLIETGAQTDQETFATSLNGTYQMSGKLSLDLGVNQSFRYLNQGVASEGLSNTREWSTADWLNYQLEPQLKVGIGAGFSYINVSVGPDMTSEQLQARIIWQIGNKLSFQLSGGLNDLQFLNSAIPDLLTPIASLSAQYRLFEPTTLSISVNRTVAPSYFQSETTEGTTVSAGVRQRLLGKLYLGVNGGYSTQTFHSTTVTPGAALSNYSTSSFNVSLSAALLKRASASIFYQETYVSTSGMGTSTALYNYSTRQAGFSLGYQF